MNTNASIPPLSGLIHSVDLAKNVFEVYTFSRNGERLSTQRLSRKKFAAQFTHPQGKRGTIVMEACGSAYYWARRFNECGHRAYLVPPQFVAQRRIGSKNDGNDADAIFAVYLDRRVKPVPVKTVAQQDLSALHRRREGLVKQRTQCTNQVRGLLAERGVVERAGPAGFNALLRRINQQPEPQVTPALQRLVATIAEQLAEIDTHIKRVEQALAEALKASPTAQQVQTIFGIGLITATAYDADYGPNLTRFGDGRQFAASIGLTPGEHSSGEKRRRGKTTKRGNPYLRKLLVQCANVIVNLRNTREDALCLLARRLFAANKGRTTVVVAIANRLARMIYAIVKHNRPYQPNGRTVAA